MGRRLLSVSTPFSLPFTAYQAKAVFSTSLEHFYNPKDLVVSGPIEPVSREAVQAIYAQIKKAEKPLLYVGGGCNGCAPELRAFVAATGIPVVQTLMGIGAVPAAEERNLGMLGMHGTVAANYAVFKSDLLLAFGVR